jgi:hypothetical protein
LRWRTSHVLLGGVTMLLTVAEIIRDLLIFVGVIAALLLASMGVPIALIWYWFTFLRDARRAVSDTPSQNSRGIPGH